MGQGEEKEEWALFGARGFHRGGTFQQRHLQTAGIMDLARLGLDTEMEMDTLEGREVLASGLLPCLSPSKLPVGVEAAADSTLL